MHWEPSPVTIYYQPNHGNQDSPKHIHFNYLKVLQTLAWFHFQQESNYTKNFTIKSQYVNYPATAQKGKLSDLSMDNDNFQDLLWKFQHSVVWCGAVQCYPVQFSAVQRLYWNE